ncbi:MAG: hypothetical protein IT342_16630 [Candidatus Melainabacteria bacterium]|nr:hypothetical protein [Candidatus Melainabacteria bacterium]
MVETYDSAPTVLGDMQGKNGKVIAQPGEGQPEAENLATKDPSATLLEGSQPAGEVAEVENSSGISLTEAGLAAGVFVAGALGQKYGLNRQALAMAGRGLETMKTAAFGVTDLAPYARVAERNIDTLGSGWASRFTGSLRPGGEIIDKQGKIFMSTDGTLVATDKLSPFNPINAINRYGDAAQFLRSDMGVQSFTSTVGRGPINGFAIKHEANDLLPQLSTTTLRDGNRFARFMQEGHVLEGKGVFTEAQMNAAIQQGQATTNSLYQSVLKFKV